MSNEEIADNIGKSGCWVEGCHYETKAKLLAVEKENGELRAKNERLVLALKDIKLYIQNSPQCEQLHETHISTLVDQAVATSPSTPIHEAIEGAINALLMTPCPKCENGDGIDGHDGAGCYKKEAISTLRKSVGKV